MFQLRQAVTVEDGRHGSIDKLTNSAMGEPLFRVLFDNLDVEWFSADQLRESEVD